MNLRNFWQSTDGAWGIWQLDSTHFCLRDAEEGMVSFRGMTGSKERTWEKVLPSPIAKITHLCRCLHFIPLILSLSLSWLASSPDAAQNTAFPPGSPCSTSTTLSGKVWSQPPYFPSTSSPDNSAHTPFPSATLHFLNLAPIRHRDSGKIIPEESQLLQHNTFSQDSTNLTPTLQGEE